MLLGPSHIAIRQWKLSFDRGIVINPAIALLSSATYGFLSYRLYGTLNHQKAELYALSAAFILSIWPWTLLLMSSTNGKLFKKYEEAKEPNAHEKLAEVGVAEGETTKELIKKWGALNIGRGVLPFLGAVLGTWASLT